MKKINLILIISLVVAQISLLGQNKLKTNIRIDAGLSSIVINEMSYDGYGLSAGVNVFINKYLYSSLMIGIATGEDKTTYHIFTPTSQLQKFNFNVGGNLPLGKFNFFTEGGLIVSHYKTSQILLDIFSEINGKKYFSATTAGYLKAGFGLGTGFRYRFSDSLQIGLVFSHNQFFQHLKNKNTHQSFSISVQKSL